MKKKIILSFLSTAILAIALFIYNGLSIPVAQYGKIPVSINARSDSLTIMAYNLAKCYVFKSDTFKTVSSMKDHLDKVASLITAEKPQLVFLSEVVGQCGPCPINQVEYLAKKAGYPYWAFGENYSWGLPFYRMRSGNGILSNFPLDSLEVIQLTGAKPFYNPTNNRRLLKAKVQINKQRYTIASVHNDSYSRDNNLKQTLQILNLLDRNEAILGGDFNAERESSSMKLLKESGRFTAAWESPPTFPARKPKRAIDFVLAPAGWQLISHKALSSRLSDHLPVISSFKLQNGD